MNEILIEKRIATELKNTRKKLDLTQEEVGARLKKTQNWVKNIELGKTKISLFHLLKLCTLYQLQPSEIFKNIGQ